MGRNASKRSGWDEIDGGMGFVIPVTALRSANLTRLSPHACKLLLDLARQYSGFNNGYLCAAWSLMKDQGWNSPTTLHKAILELEHYQVIVRTRQGGLNRANLHAFTWRRVNEKPEKPLDVGPSFEASNNWKFDQPDFTVSFGEAGRLPKRQPMRKAA